MRAPKIRFDNCKGKITSYSAGEVFRERKEKGRDDLPILSLSIHTGISDHELDDGESTKKVKRSEDKTLYKTVHKYDLAFNMMRAWQGAFGVAMVEGMISPAYIVAEPIIPIDPHFLNYYVQTTGFINQANNLSYGVTDFRKRLYWDSFCKIQMSFPPLQEQRKIADTLITIDEIIEYSEQEIVLFEKQKEYMLKIIFSNRLSLTSDTGSKWETKKLGEIADLYQPATISKAQCVDDGIYPVFGANGYLGMYDKANHETDQVCVGCRGTCGTVNYVKAPVWITGNSMVCNVDENKDIDKYFLYQLLQSLDFKTIITGGAQPQITRNVLSKVKVAIPSLNEQERISQFLKEFDTVIEIARDELEEWKQLKKSLLQQLFV